MNYDVVCESCEAAVISAPHIGDPEANELVKHLLDHHRDRVDPSRRPAFAEVVREFRLQKGSVATRPQADSTPS